MRQLEHHEIPSGARTWPITLLCADWTDPRNVGSAFRLADSAGLERLILSGTTPRPPHPKIRKTARATEGAVAYECVDDAVTYVAAARDRGAVILALEITDASVSLFDYTPLAREVVLIAGNEAGGVPPALLACCDAAVHLPMYGRNTSMNVAVALGAAVYLLLMKLQ
ncbi:TrmH family RNA methyltransferase [Neolewinella litorea]|uniref:tRNA methyltransferase n=1 Tax=Neolewinella litorea TaxID=2562452 RepID=A0A4S4NJM8_9BACT|nr:TrmH family RNA methyltransferase [Neolewinella litorea]THH39992.1 tRNA methyltransferase [Neolewinella litorea]